jgi:hypothetical protein
MTRLPAVSAAGLLIGFAEAILIFAPRRSGDFASAGAASAWPQPLAMGSPTSTWNGSWSGGASDRHAIGLPAPGSLCMAGDCPRGLQGAPSPRWNAATVASVLVLGLIGTGATYVLNCQIISSEGATVASTVAYLVPVVAIILGVIVLNESITALIVPGIILILVGQWCHARVSCTSRTACIAVGNYGNAACGHPGTWAIDHTYRAEKRRPVRRPPGRFRVLRRGHRQPGLLRRAHPVVPAAARRPGPSRHDPGVLSHRAQPGQRRPRRPLRYRRRGRPAPSRCVPDVLGAEDHGLAGLPGQQPDRRHLRRGRRLGRLPWRDIRLQPRPPEHARAGQGRARRRPDRRGPAVPLIKPGTVSTACYNHYSLLRSIEDIFALPHLGDAAMPQVRSFGPGVFR